jgi:hypothetical protein
VPCSRKEVGLWNEAASFSDSAINRIRAKSLEEGRRERLVKVQ